MQFTSHRDKYELLEQLSPDTSRVRHALLGREVILQRLACPNPATKTRLCSDVSRWTHVDHPAIPHLMDFFEEGDFFQLVVESPRGTTLEQALLTLDPLTFGLVIERTADALCHAKQRTLAHGELSWRSIRIDRTQQVTVSGIGLRQLREQLTPQELYARDTKSLLQLLRGGLDHLRTRYKAGSVPSISLSDNDNTSEMLLAIDTLSTRILDQTEPDCDICELAQSLRNCLQEQYDLQAKRTLSFALPDDKPTRRTMRSLTMACAASTILLASLLLAAWWPASIERTSTTPMAATPELPPADRGNLTRSTVSATGVISIAKRPVSRAPIAKGPSLADAGVINQAADLRLRVDVEDQPTVQAETDPAQTHADSDSDSDSGATASKVMPLSDSSKDGAANSPTDSPARKSDPFLGLPVAISLSDTDQLEPQSVVTTDLTDSDALDLALVGGTGAFRRGTFSIASQEPNGWLLHFENRDATLPIARLTRQHQELVFQWLAESDAEPAASYLCNTLLELRCGTWSHVIALREPTTLPLIHAVIDHRTRHTINIDFLPDLAQIFLEFNEHPDTLTMALGHASVGVSEGELRLGLEAGKNSLVMMRVQPQVKRRIDLNFIPVGRLETRQPVRPIRRGYRTQLQQNILVAQNFVLGATPRLDAIQDAKEKRSQQSRIESAESQVVKMRSFLEACDAAANTPLRLSLVRRVDNAEVVLVQFVTDEHTDSPPE